MKLRHTLVICALCAAANAISVSNFLLRRLVSSATDDYGRPKPHQDPQQLDPYVEASEIAAKPSVSAGPDSSKSMSSTQKGSAAGLPTLPLAPLVALLLI